MNTDWPQLLMVAVLLFRCVLALIGVAYAVGSGDGNLENRQVGNALAVMGSTVVIGFLLIMGGFFTAPQ